MLWSWLVIAGAIHGVLLALYLFFAHKKQRIAYFYLGSAVLFYSLYLIFSELVREHTAQYPHLIALAFPIIFLIGPFFYLFVVFINKNGNSLKLFGIFHFLPAFFCVIYLIPFFLQSSADKLSFLENARTHGTPLDMTILWLLGCIHVLLYMLFIIPVIRQYQKDLKNQHSNVDSINLQWLLQMSIGNGIVWGFYALLFMLYAFHILVDPLGIPDVFFSLIMAMLLFFMGYKVLRSPLLFEKPEVIPSIKKYAKSGLQESEIKQWIEKLEAYMRTEKPYKNADLSLKMLAESLNFSPQHLSQLLNEQFGKNFYDYINEYRVKEVIILIDRKDFAHYTLLGLAYEAGFKSKSTFNAIFKKVTGSTPSHFRNKI